MNETKKIRGRIVLFFLVICAGLFSQAPQTINYQGVLRDVTGIPITTLSSIGVQFVIANGSNVVVHNETQTNVPVNQMGLFSTKIGGTTPISNSINWGNGPFTLSVSVDPGTGFALIGSQQLASVPFALFAQNASPQNLSVNGNSLSISNGNTVVLPGSISYTNGAGISITGSVIANTAPDQTVTISNGVNVNVSGTYPNFTVDATPSLAVLGNQLSITGGNSVTLPTGTTYTNGPGITFFNGTVITNAAPDQTVTISGPGVTGTYPNFTLNPGPATSITGTGISTVTGAAPNFTVNTLAANITGGGGVTVLGAYPNFTVSSPAAVTPTITGLGIASVTPLTGNNFTVNVAAPNFVGIGGTSVTGTYPNYSISTGTLTSDWSILGNAGTSPATNFIGTTDNNALVFKTNNQKSGRLDPAGSSFFGYQSGNNNTNISASGFGFQSLFNNTSGSNNTGLGYLTLFSNTTGNGNTAGGSSALYTNLTGVNNSAFGYNSLFSNSTGNSNTGVGAGALYSNTNGSSNMALGGSALYFNTAGSSNNAFGAFALYSNVTGSNNLAIGASAGYNNTGSGNVFIGHNAGFSANASNQLWIANSNAAIPLIFGDFAAANVGIGTTAPLSRLHVADVNSKITVDATGGGAAVASLDLKTLGAGTASLYKFNTGRLALASGGAYNMQFLNSIGGSYQFDEGVNTRLFIAPGGNVGVNNNAPTANLHVVGTTRLQDATAGLDKILRSDALGNATWVNSPINTGFSAYNGAIQNLTVSPCQITFPSEDYDDGNNFNGNQFVAPTPGVYHFDSGVRLNGFPTAGNYIYIYIAVNGAVRKDVTSQTSTSVFGLNISVDTKLNAGDVVTVMVWTGLTTESTPGGQVNVWFTGHRVY